MKLKWIFDIKGSGLFKVGLVAYVQEFVLDGFIKVVFVRTNKNDADIFTKNLGGDLHERHSRKMIIEKGKA